MPKLFSVRTNDGEYEGVTAAELRQWAEEGRITPNDLVRDEEKQRWHKADSVHGLFQDEQIGLDEPIATPASHPQGQARQAPKKKPRYLLIAFLWFVPIATFMFIPAISLGIGVLLLGLVVFYMLPQARTFVGAVCRVSPNQPARRGVKLAAIGLFGVFLIVLASGGASIKERNRLDREAKMSREIQQVQRVTTADDEVKSLVREARAMLESGDIDGAITKLNLALEVASSDNKEVAASILQSIKDAGDGVRVFELLVSLTDDQFIAFRDTGDVPIEFKARYDALTTLTVELAKNQLVRAAEERADRERKHIAAIEAKLKKEVEEREEARLVEETRKILEAEERDLARWEQEEKTREKLDAFAALLELAEVQSVEKVSVEMIVDDIWEATLTVDDYWHIRHKQIRLQDAQALWEAWANIASPKMRDFARIRIVDQRGNEVGGSRILAGSLIWVKD